MQYHLSRGAVPTREQARFWIISIASALEWLHKNYIIHRDLKPANILLDSEGFIKIADFGLSVNMKSRESLPTSCCGTVGYIAPEMYLGPSWDKNKKTKCGAQPELGLATKIGMALTRTIGTPGKIFPEMLFRSQKVNHDENDSSKTKESKKKRSGAKGESGEGLAKFKMPRYSSYGSSIDYFALGVTIHQFYCYGMVRFGIFLHHKSPTN